MSSSAGSSPLSSLSSVPSDDEAVMPFMLDGADAGEDAALSDVEIENSKVEREVSPPHEEVLADNPDIAFIVMFRARFSEAFSQKLTHFGPQDIERGVVDSKPSPQIEQLLCALLGLLLNRKKPIENGHHGRALEEAIQSKRSQWPQAWNNKNPLSGNSSFNTMSPTERLTLLRTLIMWSLHDSDAINAIIKESYKQARLPDDLNVSLSVQPWGTDSLKRRYWLIEGRDDTPFRLCRENNPALKNGTWRSVAGTIEELQAIGAKLEKESSKNSRVLAGRIRMAIPRFEATEEKRRRREYRLARKAAFVRPEPGFSMYEGRTRGKRQRYTYDDEEEEELSEALGTRRSTRNAGATSADERPTITSSGRQVRSRAGGVYGEILLSGQNTSSRASPATDASDAPVRASRSGRAGFSRRQLNEDGETSSEGEWDGGDEDEADGLDEPMDDLVEEGEESSEDDGSDEDEDEDEQEPKSLVVTLRVPKGRSPSAHLQTLQKLQLSDQPRPSSPQVVIEKHDLATSASTNGYPSPASSGPAVGGSNQLAMPTNVAAVLATNGLSSSSAFNAPKKQSQLPFQPIPQHLKP